MTAFRPKLTLLAPEESERIVGEACAVLERVGVVVENDEARALLLGAGAKEHQGRLQLPERLVRSEAAKAPSRIRLFDRDGALALDLGEDRVHFDPGSAAIHLLDHEKGARREVTTRDLARMCRLVEGLPHYAAQSTAIIPADVPADLGDRWRLCVALLNCHKPIVTGTFRKDAFAPMRAMLEAVRGGPGALAEKPLAVFDCCPSPPLKWSDLTCQALLDAARAGIPCTMLSMPLTGATSPVTLREAVVQHAAENLSGVTLTQLAKPGASVIWGGCPSAFDMRLGTTPVGAIESMMMTAAYAQVGKHLGLPTHGYLVMSDAKCVDYQAGFESGMGAVLAALAGINLVSGPGMLDNVSCQSFEKVLLDHEVCGEALRLARGIQRREGDVPALFAELVQLKAMLSHPHTRKHWREELSVPSAALVDRQSYGDWEAGGRQRADGRAAAEVTRRLAEGASPGLAEPLAREVERVMAAEARRLGANLPSPRA